MANTTQAHERNKIDNAAYELLSLPRKRAIKELVARFGITEFRAGNSLARVARRKRGRGG